MPRPEFGAHVVVAAQTIRVVQKLEPDGPTWRQTARARDAERFARHDLSDATHWPGAPIPFWWAALHPDEAGYFDLEPPADAADRVHIRLRRICTPIPETGVIIGTTTKAEGTVYETAGDHARSLSGPGRRVLLAEVALPPIRAKARLVLAHPRDLQVIA